MSSYCCFLSCWLICKISSSRHIGAKCQWRFDWINPITSWARCQSPLLTFTRHTLLLWWLQISRVQAMKLSWIPSDSEVHRLLRQKLVNMILSMLTLSRLFLSNTSITQLQRKHPGGSLVYNARQWVSNSSTLSIFVVSPPLGFFFKEKNTKIRDQRNPPPDSKVTFTSALFKVPFIWKNGLAFEVYVNFSWCLVIHLKGEWTKEESVMTYCNEKDCAAL